MPWEKPGNAGPQKMYRNRVKKGSSGRRNRSYGAISIRGYGYQENRKDRQAGSPSVCQDAGNRIGQGEADYGIL